MLVFEILRFVLSFKIFGNTMAPDRRLLGEPENSYLLDPKEVVTPPTSQGSSDCQQRICLDVAMERCRCSSMCQAAIVASYHHITKRVQLFYNQRLPAMH